MAPTKARQLSEGASFGPEALQAIGQAFDEAWAEVVGNFGDEPEDVEKARQQLAKAFSQSPTRTVAMWRFLKRAALQRMALDYRRAADLGIYPIWSWRLFWV
jgi:hypothetical protein